MTDVSAGTQDNLHEAPVAGYFADALERLAGGEQPDLRHAAYTLCSLLAEGHICVDLGAVAAAQRAGEHGGAGEADELSRIEDDLLGTGLVGRPGEFKPLILDESRKLYLHRYWRYESDLAAKILELATRELPLGAEDQISEELDRLFSDQDPDDVKDQQRAIRRVAKWGFTIISGGPGTGKTTTVANLIALFLRFREVERLPQVALAAPTGKAATQLKEAIQRRFLDSELLDEQVIGKVCERASTVHRLLGPIPNSVCFRHDRDNPLPVDLVVVDEVSMVDIALMAKLLDAIDPARTRVVLLGDCDQLASVEPGSILGDLADAAESRSTSGDRPLRRCFVRLTKNWRFDERSGILKFTHDVRLGRADSALAVLDDEAVGDLTLGPLPEPGHVTDALEERIVEGYKPCLHATTPSEALSAFGRFRVISALRRGPYGSERLNRDFVELFHGRNLIRGSKLGFRGMPILIKENDYTLKLFNGDTGVLFPDPDGQGHALFAWFIGDDGRLRRISPLRLPSHEVAFVTTVHRSQGSEFDEVILVLTDKMNPVLTRELIYTGISRARRKAHILSSRAILVSAVHSKSVRNSGLVEKLTSAR